MPYYRYIDDFCIGNTYRLYRYLDSTPGNSPITDAWLTIKESVTDPDSDALIQLHITVSGTSNGAVVIANDLSAQVQFIILPSDSSSAGFNMNSTYYYDIKIKLQTAEEYTLETGKLFTLNIATKTT